MSETQTVLCGTCRVAPQPTSDDHALEWKCPKCGAADTREAIFSEAKAHAVDVAQRGLNDMLKKTAARSKFLSFKPGATSTRRFRWVTNVTV